jgi:hypothetical protein
LASRQVVVPKLYRLNEWVDGNHPTTNSMMRQISQLPIELFFIIRDHLFRDVAACNQSFNSWFDVFSQNDSRRSWRNFLSASATKIWKLVRRTTMVWSLDCFQSKKYLTNKIYREYLLNRMFRPSEQLQLRIGHSKPIVDIRNQPIVFSWIPRPLSLGLHTLKICHCQTITRLGDLKTLKVLILENCKSLVFVGKMGRIKSLSLSEVGVNLLRRFPLETIEHLLLVGDHVLEFKQNLGRFRSLKTLSLQWHFGPPIQLPFLSYTSLETLELDGFTSIDVTGFINLKSLRYQSNKYRPGFGLNIIGKEFLSSRLRKLYSNDDERFHYSQLKSLDYSYDASSYQPINWNEINNIPNLKLDRCNLTSDAIVVGEGVQSLQLRVLNLKTVEFADPERIFGLLLFSLPFFSENDLWRFSHLEYVELYSMPYLTDISPIQQVPAIYINGCKAIQNFSCLGKSQRYLLLDCCDSLQNSDLASFSSIYILKIIYCPNITRIAEIDCHSNSELMIFGCSNITTISFSGFQHLKVGIFACGALTTLNITGKIYLLLLQYCYRCHFPWENCEYVHVE